MGSACASVQCLSSFQLAGSLGSPWYRHKMKLLSVEIETREVSVSHWTPLTRSLWPLRERMTFGPMKGSMIRTELAVAYATSFAAGL